MVLLSTLGLGAQTAPVEAPNTPYTLHVYQDLVQLPTLVLDPRLGSYAGLTASQFTLQLDGGPPFHPHHTRLQGDDALEIAIILDVSHADTRDAVKKLAESPPDRMEHWLAPEDRFTLYALDCHLIRAATSLPYAASRLHWALDQALSAPNLHKHDKGTSCGTDRRLWDSLATVVGAVGQLPGRRVVLVISDGQDETSRFPWGAVARYAGAFNTTVVGLRTSSLDPAITASALRSGMISRAAGAAASGEDLFALLCMQTGGPVLRARPQTLVTEMDHAVDLLRHRYILDFPRPRSDVPGFHQITVVIPDRRATVLAASIAFPPRRADIDTEPGSIPTDPTQAPTPGNRRVLGQPRQ